MIFIVGLGNPSKKYQKTAHNVGFRVIDEFRRKNNFPDFRISKKIKALISEGFLNNKKIFLIKPQTFMNLSGKSIKLLTQFNNLEPKNLIVIHDDIDLLLGKIRISKAQGSAGHKGVKSIIEEIKTKNFIRFRIGIQPKKGKPKNVEKFVLQKFSREKEAILKEVIEKAVEAIEFFLKQGLEKAMSKFNR